jgi:hypothetical protein
MSHSHIEPALIAMEPAQLRLLCARAARVRVTIPCLQRRLLHARSAVVQEMIFQPLTWIASNAAAEGLLSQADRCPHGSFFFDVLQYLRMDSL